MFTHLRWLCLLLLALLLPAITAQARQQGERPGDTLFIEASLDNKTPWVGQEVLLTYTLFFSEAAPQIEDRSKPEHPGIWAREIEPETYIDSTPVTVGGIRYRKAVIRQLRLVAMQSGKLPVSGYQLRCLVPKTREVTIDTRTDTETILTAPPVTIEARALPQPSPPGFSGAVGSFSVTVAPGRSEVRAGEPLDLSITLTGTGNLDTLPALTVTLPEGIRRQESAVPVIVSSKREGRQATVTTKITLIPSRAGAFRFAPVRLIGFDPQKGRYGTVISNEIAVEVLPATAASQPQPATAAPATAGGQESAASPVTPIMVTLAIIVLALIFGRHLRHLKTGRSGSLAIAEPPAKPGNSGAEPTAKARKTTEPPPAAARWNSAESVRNGLYEALKSAGIRNPAGLTAKELGEKLKAGGARTETIEAVRKLLASIDQALYTPGKSSPESLEAMSRSASQVIASLPKR